MDPKYRTEYFLSPRTEDWIFTESDRAAADSGCYFDLQKALRVKQFFEKFLRHTVGRHANKPFDLLPWQWNQVVAPAFGWMTKDGFRRFGEVEIWIPKKNGKSTLLAGLALYLLVADKEQGAQVYSAAADREQASLIYRTAQAMVGKSDVLTKLLRVVESKRLMNFDITNSFYKVLAADGFRNEGLDIHGLLFDELHTQKNRKLWAALRYGTAARDQGIKFVISTAGEMDDTQLWYERFNLAKQIQESKIIDTQILPCVYAMEEGEDWQDPLIWEKCNPSYGQTVNPVEFARAFQSAKVSPINKSEFLRYRLNRATQNDAAWLAHIFWEQATSKGLLPTDHEHNVYVAFDLADFNDLNAMTIVHLLKDENGKNVIQLEPYCWCPSNKLLSAVSRNNTEKYQMFSKLTDAVGQPLIRLIDGNVIDQEIIEDQVVDILGEKIKQGCRIQSIVVDRFNAVRFSKSLTKKLRTAGIRKDVELMAYNAVTLNEPINFLMEMFMANLIRCPKNPLMDWMYNNVSIVRDSSGNRKFDKSNEAAKIDIFAAAALAIAAFVQKQPEFRSQYETKGLTIFEVGI